LKEDAKPADALILTSALRINSSSSDSTPEFRHTDMPNFRNILSEDIPSEAEEDTAGHSSEHADWSSLATDDYYEDDEQPASTPVIDFIRHSRTAEPETTAFSDAEENWEPEFIDGTLEVGTADKPDPIEAAEDLADDKVTETVTPSVEGESSDDMGKYLEVEASDVIDLQSEIVEPERECLGDDWHVVDDGDKDDSLVEEAVFASAAAASVMDEASDQGTDEKDVKLADFDENLIDEDALRDLVAEIVRQELTGELGERITRNVRKLVRREIHRALLTREFE
jgi:hypothetical protein